MKPTLSTTVPNRGDGTYQFPSMEMLELLYGSLEVQLIATAAELRVADLLTDGARDVDDLADRTGTHAGALYRVLRALASMGVFSETAPRRFGLTPLAATLRTGVDGSMRDIALNVGSRERHAAYELLSHAVRTGRPSFDEAHGEPLWSYLLAHPAHADNFNHAMGDLARQAHAAAVQGYDLSRARRLIDVGGGQGHLVATLLTLYPHLRAVVFDEPHVVVGAAPVLAEAGVTDRAEAIGGEMFDAVPTGGDVYVLSSILVGYADDDADTILTNVRRAMDEGATVLIIEPVIPEGDVPHTGKLLDVVQLALHTGGSRTEAEFEAMFDRVGLRRLETRSMTPQSPTDLVVAGLA